MDNTSRANHLNCQDVGEFHQTVHTLHVESATNFVEYSYSLAVFLLMINIIMVILTVFGNLTVILTVFVYRQLRVPANLMVASLSLADLLTGLIIQPSNAFNLLEAIRHNKRPCTDTSAAILLYAFGVVTVTASLANLSLITFDRYIAIVYSLKYASIMIDSRAKFAIMYLWISSVVLAITVSFLSAFFQEVRSFWYTYLLLICIFMVIMYSKFYRISRKHANNIKAEVRSIYPEIETKLERRSMVTVTIVTVSLIISYIPHTVLRTEMILNVKPHNLTEDVIRQFTLTFLLLNSTINPFLYFFRSRKLKNYSRKLLVLLFNYLK
jgi:hypothetical protein